MIQQEDIDAIKELNLPQPVGIKTLKVGDFFSFVPDPSMFWKILKIDEETGEVFAKAVSGVFKNHEITFPSTSLIWHWTKKENN